MRKIVTAKNLVLLLLIGLLLSALTTCGGSDSADSTGADRSEQTIEADSIESDSIESDSKVSDSGEADSSDSDSGEADSGELSAEFKKTMDDYEAWFDHYCEVMKKYEENPSDIELLSEMTDLLAEETKMLEQMENMDQSEMNAAELAYYIEVTARIEKKLLEVAY